MQIDHNPNEKRMTNGIWWIVWPIVALGWIGTWYSFGFNWQQIALGGFTGMVLASFAIEKSGNKFPGSR